MDTIDNKQEPSLWHYVNVLPKYSELAFKMRGEFINETIKLERTMDAFIASHFCSDDTKRRELQLLILCTERITYENKRQVLKWIVENYHQDLIKAHSLAFEGKMFKELQEIGEFRNLLAHTYLDIDNFVENEQASKITLRRYKNEIDIIDIDEKMMKEKIEKIHLYMNMLAHWEYPNNFPL